MAVGRKPGTPKTGGRQLGSPNKETFERKHLEAVLAKLRLDPIERVARIARGDKLPNGEEIPVKLIAEANFRLLNKFIPDLKAIEHSGDLNIGLSVRQQMIDARRKRVEQERNASAGQG